MVNHWLWLMDSTKTFGGFQSMNFGRTLVFWFQFLPLILGGWGCWIDLYEVFLFYINYCLMFYFMTIPAPFFAIFVVSLSLGEMSSRDIGQKYFIWKSKSLQVNCVGGWLLIDGLNEAFNNIYFSYLKVGYDSMSAIHFRRWKKVT